MSWKIEGERPFLKESYLYRTSWKRKCIMTILYIFCDLIVSNEARSRVINVRRKRIYFTYVANYATPGLIALGKIQMYLSGIQIVALCLRHRKYHQGSCLWIFIRGKSLSNSSSITKLPLNTENIFTLLQGVISTFLPLMAHIQKMIH